MLMRRYDWRRDRDLPPSKATPACKLLLISYAAARIMSANTLVSDFLNSPDGPESPAVGQLPAELAQLIIQHRANLLDIVRASGEYLTSDDDKRRGRGGQATTAVSRFAQTLI